MEGAGGHARAQAERAEAVAQLARGLAGEGEGEDVAGVGVAGLDPPGDAPGQHPGLARPGRRQDGQGPRRRGHRPALRVVEVVEQAIGTATAGEVIRAPGHLAQSVTAPADALRTVPVIMRARSDARNTAAFAVSAVCGKTFSIVPSARRAMAWSGVMFSVLARTSVASRIDPRVRVRRGPQADHPDPGGAEFDRHGPHDGLDGAVGGADA